MDQPRKGAEERRCAILQALQQADFDQEFALHFQPLMCLADGRIHSVEALLRWSSSNPQLGGVQPAEFIPLAEQAGLMHRITHWVIGEALRCAGRWQRQGVNLNMALNISALDLEKHHLVDAIKSAADANALRYEAVTLEVTETAPVRYPAMAARQVAELREVGFEVALDDFGNGYADLWQLGCLPVSEVKIDKNLLLYLEQKRCWQDMVRCVIELAHRLGLRVVAEGVENEFTQRFLQQAGCDYVQGFYHCRPLSEHALLEWVQNYQGTLEAHKKSA